MVEGVNEELAEELGDLVVIEDAGEAAGAASTATDRLTLGAW